MSEGQLRFSDSQGQVFDVLPCLEGSLDVDEILSVSFTDRKAGRDARRRATTSRSCCETNDAGETWTPLP